MKIVVQTQFRENYGAHDWDGVGECPQYWKYKGGSTYFVVCSLEEAQDRAFWERMEVALTHSNDYSEEYIVSSVLVDDIDFVASEHHAEWENPYYVHEITEGNFHFNRTIRNDDEYGYMRNDIASKYESYFIRNGGEMENYNCSYTLRDGTEMSYSELQQHLTEAA